MITLYFARHGQTQWNVEKRLQGRQDSPLTERGVLQANALADRLKVLEIDRIFTSSALRARRTAETILAARTSPVDLVATDALLEIDLGVWEGMTKDEVAERYPANANAFWHRPELYVPQGGEGFERVRDRVAAFVEGVVSQGGPDASYVFVSHGMAIQLFLHGLREAPLSDLYATRVVHQASLTTIRANRGDPGREWTVVSLDERSHLDGLVQNHGQVV